MSEIVSNEVAGCRECDSQGVRGVARYPPSGVCGVADPPLCPKDKRGTARKPLSGTCRVADPPL
eukprot:jgi/Phyca11/82247/gw1.1.1681.1